jgi:hypothetical protein
VGTIVIAETTAGPVNGHNVSCPARGILSTVGLIMTLQLAERVGTRAVRFHDGLAGDHPQSWLAGLEIGGFALVAIDKRMIGSSSSLRI